MGKNTVLRVEVVSEQFQPDKDSAIGTLSRPLPENRSARNENQVVDVTARFYLENQDGPELWKHYRDYKAQLFCVDDPSEEVHKLPFQERTYELRFRRRPAFLGDKNIECRFDGYSKIAQLLVW